jgi:hypothetical protein
VRQKEKAFCQLLNEIRWGRVSAQTDRLLHNKTSRRGNESSVRWVASTENHKLHGMVSDSISSEQDSTSEPPELPWASSRVRLFSRNKDVDALNTARLADLAGESMSYWARDSSASFSTRLDSETRALRVLHLKVGAEVMLLQNLDCRAGLVNGSLGKVIGFVQDSGMSSLDIAGPSQGPDRQGVLLPVVRFKIERSGTHSEERTLIKEGMKRRLQSSNRGYKMFCHMGYEPWKGLSERENGSVEPIPCMDVMENSACTFLERTVECVAFTLEDAYQEVIASRYQIPLKLAYAVTIHKVGV